MQKRTLVRHGGLPSLLLVVHVADRRPNLHTDCIKPASGPWQRRTCKFARLCGARPLQGLPCHRRLCSIGPSAPGGPSAEQQGRRQRQDPWAAACKRRRRRQPRSSLQLHHRWGGCVPASIAIPGEAPRSGGATIDQPNAPPKLPWPRLCLRPPVCSQRQPKMCVWRTWSPQRCEQARCAVHVTVGVLRLSSCPAPAPHALLGRPVNAQQGALRSAASHTTLLFSFNQVWNFKICRAECGC